MTKDYVIINDEKIWYDEPFDKIPSKEDFNRWLRNIKTVLEKAIAIKNR